jgi:hypothetical protein
VGASLAVLSPGTSPGARFLLWARVARVAACLEGPGWLLVCELSEPLTEPELRALVAAAAAPAGTAAPA